MPKIVFIVFFALSPLALFATDALSIAKEESRVTREHMEQQIKILRLELTEIEEELEQLKNTPYPLSIREDLKIKAENKRKAIEALENELREIEKWREGQLRDEDWLRPELEKLEMSAEEKRHQIDILEKELMSTEERMEFLIKGKVSVSEIELLQGEADKIRHEINVLRQELSEIEERKETHSP